MSDSSPTTVYSRTNNNNSRACFRDKATAAKIVADVKQNLHLLIKQKVCTIYSKHFRGDQDVGSARDVAGRIPVASHNDTQTDVQTDARAKFQRPTNGRINAT